MVATSGSSLRSTRLRLTRMLLSAPQTQLSALKLSRPTWLLVREDSESAFMFPTILVEPYAMV